MAEAHFSYAAGPSQESFSLRLQEWVVRRRAVRARYNFVLGGTDSHYFGHLLVAELRWEYLPQADLDRLNAFLEAVRTQQNAGLQLHGAAPQPYLFGEVDLDEDEVTESEGLYMPMRPVSLVLISKTPRGAAYPGGQP